MTHTNTFYMATQNTQVSTPHLHIQVDTHARSRHTHFMKQLFSFCLTCILIFSSSLVYSHQKAGLPEPAFWSSTDFTTLSNPPFEKPWTRWSLKSLPPWGFSCPLLMREVKGGGSGEYRSSKKTNWLQNPACRKTGRLKGSRGKASGRTSDLQLKENA